MNNYTISLVVGLTAATAAYARCGKREAAAAGGISGLGALALANEIWQRVVEIPQAVVEFMADQADKAINEIAIQFDKLGLPEIAKFLRTSSSQMKAFIVELAGYVGPILAIYLALRYFRR